MYVLAAAEAIQPVRSDLCGKIVGNAGEYRVITLEQKRVGKI